MPRNGRVRVGLDDGIAESARVEAAHAIRHRALPRQHDPRRAADDGGVAGDDDLALRRDVR